MMALCFSWILLFDPNIQFLHARDLADRLDYESSAVMLSQLNPGQLRDRQAYFYYRALTEFSLGHKTEAQTALTDLLEGFTSEETPNRYLALAALMRHDMKNWKDKDLGTIARKMANVERRLGLSRGGPQTQKIQREIIQDLDQMIQEAEDAKNKAQQQAQAQDQDQSGQRDIKPMDDSRAANDSGPGKVDEKKLRGFAEAWGKLPEKERAKAIAQMSRDLPPRYREVIERYFRDISKSR